MAPAEARTTGRIELADLPPVGRVPSDRPAACAGGPRGPLRVRPYACSAGRRSRAPVQAVEAERDFG